MPQTFVITGRVESSEDINPLLGGRVEAYDRAIPSLEQRGRTPQLLGQSPIDEETLQFRIEFTDEQFHRRDDGANTPGQRVKTNPNLSFRVFDAIGRDLSIIRIVVQEREYGPEDIIFNAPSILEGIEIYIEPIPQVAISNTYEKLIASITPVTADVPLADLTESDVVFLVNQLGETLDGEPLAPQLEWLRRSALLARQTNLPAEAFFAWGCKNIPDDLERLAAISIAELPSALNSLLALEDAQLSQALQDAIADNIIPATVGDRLLEILAQLEQIRVSQGLLVARQFVGKLRNAATGEPLVGFRVQSFDLAVADQPKALGQSFSDDQGLFSFTYITLPVAEEAIAEQTQRNLRLEIFIDPQTQETVEIEVQAGEEQTVQDVSVALPTPPETPLEQLLGLSTPIASFAAGAESATPSRLVSFLQSQNINTLEALRQAGGIRRLENLPKDVDKAQVELLESHAELYTLTQDAEVSAALIDNGYSSLAQIAKTSRPDFVSALGDRVGDVKAAELQVTARAQTAFLNNLMAQEMANRANGLETNFPELEETRCYCQNCETAVSPLAYLVDLLKFAKENITVEGRALEIQDLTNYFHQPFGQLKASCEAVDTPVRQVRLCIEVLRSYLGSRPLADAAREEKLAAAEKKYLLAAYTSLLTKIGTSYFEVRSAQNGDPVFRESLANRLGIDLSHINALFLDPDATGPNALTEATLERLFGLVDTTRNPLSEGVKLGDVQNQITTWNLNNVQPGVNTDPDGKVYLKLVKGLRLEGHKANIYSVAFSPDGTRIVSGGADFMVRLWNAKTGRAIGEPLNHGELVHAIAFSPDGRFIASGGWDFMVRLWDAETGQAIRQLEGNRGHIASVAVSPDSTLVASSGWDDTVRLWSAESGEQVWEQPAHAAGTFAVVFSPDGTRIVSGGADFMVRLWDVQTGEAIEPSFAGHTNYVASVAFSSDGKFIVSGSWDSTIRLWDAQNGQTLWEKQEAHNGLVNSVAFSPDQKQIASGGADSMLRLWNAENGELIWQQLTNDVLSAVTSVAFSPDGKYIVSGGGDQVVQIWNAQTGQPVLNAVQVYRDSSLGEETLVASGAILEESGTVKLMPEDNSGLYGVLDVNFIAESPSVVGRPITPEDLISIAPIPAFLIWRLQYLRTLWKAQDWTTDAYEDSQSAVPLQQLPASIALVPPNNTFPSPSEATSLEAIRYDRDRQLLIWQPGAMTSAEREALLSLASVNLQDPSSEQAVQQQFQDAVKQLFHASQRLPVIDPDLVGPDDFRRPNPDSDVFQLWLKRSQWVSDRLKAFAEKTKAFDSQEPDQAQPLTVPNIDEMLEAMSSAVTYDATGGTLSVTAWATTTLDDLKAVREDLNDGKVAQVKFRLQDEFGLTVESFTRLMAIADKVKVWEADPQREEEVLAEEWQEVYSILTQAQKIKLFPIWRQEETGKIQFGPEDFWLSITQPQEGTWPQALSAEPAIDPSILKLKDLPDPVVGEQAIKLWSDRQKVLGQIPGELGKKRQDDGFEELLKAAFGDSLPDFDTIKTNLSNPDTAESATETIVRLHLTVDRFKRLMVIREKVETNSQPSRAEWAELYAILTLPYKKNQYYPTWKEEEEPKEGSSLEYWQIFKAKLPRWRASNENRQVWLQALLNRSQPPLIDPDLIGPGDLKNLVGGSAFQIWKKRESGIEAQLKKLQAHPKDLAGLGKRFQDTLEISKDDFLKVAETQAKGETIADRLVQLSLEFGEFNYLLRIAQLLGKNQPKLLPSEWENVDSILVQVWKRRQANQWRNEERNEGIFRSPDFFKAQLQNLFENLSGETDPKEIWRSPRLAYLDWQDQLQTRIDQEQQMSEAYREAISTVEEGTLEPLRDALILAANTLNTPDNLEAKAKWITENLLIDAKISGAITQTRVAQVIETLQTLFLALRTGRLEEQFEDLKLDLEEYEKAWRVLGSYTSWRAAMFTLLYPENLLQISLQRWQTPAFQNLLNNIQFGQNITLDKIKEDIAQYSQYFEDICALEIEASCLHKEDQKDLFYMFGRGKSEVVYWSAYEISSDDQTKYTQSLWLPLKSSDGKQIKNWDNLREIVGARIHTFFDFAEKNEQSYVFLFAIRVVDKRQSLVYAKYDIKNRSWSHEASILPDIPGISSSSKFEISLMQSDTYGAFPAFPVFAFLQVRAATPRWDYFISLRLLNLETNNWESIDDFSMVPRDSAFTSERFRLSAIIDNSPGYGGEAFIILSDNFNTVIGAFELIYDGPFAVDIIRTENVWTIKGSYLGTITFPVENRTFSKGVYFFVGNAGKRELYSFDSSSGSNPFRYEIGQDGLAYFTPISGLSSSSERYFIEYTKDSSRAEFLCSFKEGLPSFQSISYVVSAKPFLGQDLDSIKNIQVSLDIQAQDRQTKIQRAFEINLDGLEVNMNYLYEAYFFVPMQSAIALQRSGEYLAALDLFRTVYDYTAKEDLRKIYYGLIREESLELTYNRQDWLLDPLNPHLIAITRQNTYTRFTLFTIIRCLLEFADSEFTQDTSESNARARSLYLTAQELLESKELKQTISGCSKVAGFLDDVESDDPRWKSTFVALREEVSSLPSLQSLRKVVPEIQAVLRTTEPIEERFADARTILDRAIVDVAPAPVVLQVIEQAENTNRQMQPSLLLAPALQPALQTLRPTSIAANDRTSQLPSGYIPLLVTAFCIPVNPILQSLRLRTETSLKKLRTGLNIAGLKRQLAPYSAPTDATSGLPIIGTGGQLVSPGVTINLQPTLYRYQVLIERAKQLVQLAAQVEAGYLSAEAGFLGAKAGGLGAIAGVQSDEERREDKRFDKGYSILKAQQDLGLAQAEIQLQDLRLKEAKNGVSLANVQTQRSTIQAKHYQRLLSKPFSDSEIRGLTLLDDAADDLATAAGLSTGATVGQSIFGTLEGAMKGLLVGGIKGAIIGGLIGGATPALSGASSVVSLTSSKKTIRASAASTRASYERRTQEWRFQKDLAEQDIIIGENQILLANDRVGIVGQEKAIAQLQTTNAQDAVKYLEGRITENPELTNTLKLTVEQFKLTAELYDYIRNTLQEVYRYFLQQATAIAKLAENQLAFERQEVPPTYIQSDYWSVPITDTVTSSPNTETPDRRGLTGSARLLQDVYQLDQYAFTTDKRKLQLTKTFSLASLAPVEFQQFRETGVLLFSTPMELFDRDFPGHYLRLIRRVRTSVIALIPPTQGIKATLSTVGITRVVVGPDIFQTIPIRRDPEFVALTSPTNATGLFELESLQPDFLLPFEGNGVDSSWEFRMPKAANQFDYRTIADVLITIEYTALNSNDYRQQVIQTLNPNLSSDRPFSFRNQFADQWYDLNNPEQTKTPMKVKFETFREDFPPNLDNLKIQQVLLYFVRSTQTSAELPITQLRFTEQGNQGTVGGSATPINGIISTRRGSAGSWTALIGKAPIGEWELTLPNTEEVKQRFANEEIDDILFVITYSGRTPPWPE